MLNIAMGKIRQTDILNAVIAIGARKTYLTSPPCKDTFVSRNLLHFLKKKLRTTGEISDFVKNLPDKERYLGALPDKWRKNFDPKDLKAKTLEIQEIFSNFAQKCSTPEEIPVQNLSKEAEELAKSLGEYFGECKVIPFNSGSLGKIFKIECGGESLALKIYHNNPAKSRLEAHGQTKEIANAIHLNKAMKPDRCARFYCGKIGLEGDTDAFMLTQFVKPKYREPGEIRPENLWRPERFYFGDSKSDNFAGQKLVDFGSVYYNFDTINQREYAKELYRLIYSGDTAGIKKMLRRYGGDADFDSLVAKIKTFIQEEANYPRGFGMDARDFTKKEIAGYKALGVDFSGIEKFDYADNNELKEAVIKIGLQKPETPFRKFLNSLQRKMQSAK